MKLLCLNLWGARQGKVLFDYLKGQAKDTDIFCFQEVFGSKAGIFDFNGARPALLDELRKLLPDFGAYYEPTYYGWIDKQKVDFEVSEGQAIFVRKGLKVKDSGCVYIYGSADTKIALDFTNEPKNLVYALLEVEDKELLVVNPHGKWHPGDKLDTEERMEQSEKIVGFLSKYSCLKAVCGDFNLMPDTESIKILEKSGLANLIKKFGITNTRNEISWQLYHNKQSFADYIFISPEIKVKSLEVPYNEVSDHLPMIVDFQI